MKIYNYYDLNNHLRLVNTYINLTNKLSLYFYIYDLPQTLSLGLNSFRINLKNETFKIGSTILILLIDSRDKTVYLTYYPVLVNDSRLITIYVTPETAQGVATLSVVGILNNLSVPEL